MKKKIIFTAILAGMVMVLSACGSNEKYNTIDASLESKVTELAQYKGLSYEPEEVTVTDEEIEEEMDMELSWYGTYQALPDKTTAENGDTVNIAFKGTIDGAEFEGGTSESYDLTLGEGEMIEGFEEAIVGKNVGDTVTVDLVFPEDYFDEEAAGKNVTFEITLNQIEEYVEPELTDEFVKENLEYDNVEAFREETKNSLIESATEAAKEEAQAALLEEIIENSKFEMVESEVSDYREALIEEYKSYAEMYGMEYGDFLEMFVGTTEEAFEEESKSLAENSIQTTLIYQAIIEKEDLGVTEKEYQKAVKDMAEEYEYDSVEEFEADYDKPSIIEELLYEKVMDFIIENAKGK
ncbi:MAG: trigger factor [Roseburia sp.]|nr:trigger factor [Roseburia sp.]MCM1279411.1 trigger factor [Robinsoniella sp.]